MVADWPGVSFSVADGMARGEVGNGGICSDSQLMASLCRGPLIYTE